MTYYEKQVRELGEKFEQKEYLYSQLSNAKQYMRAHFSDAITIESIASAACFSKFHFLRLFKAAYNCTPHEYLTSVRIEKAKQLLLNDCNTTDVCLQIGFNSASTFRQLFKKHTRKTPAGYRMYMQRYRKHNSNPVPTPFFLHYKKAIFKPGTMAGNSHL